VSAGKIGIEVEHFVAAEADGIGRSDLLVDQIAKLAGEVADGNAEAIGTEKRIAEELADGSRILVEKKTKEMRELVF